MPDRPRLRPALPADAAALAAIYAPAVLHGTATFELDPPDATEMARRLAAISEAGYPYLVAEVSGVVVGYAYLAAYRARPAYRWTVEDSVYVADGMQGRGIGRALLQALVAAGEARGYRQVVAVIGDSRQSASIALHRSAGFNFSGVLHAVGYKAGRWLDTVLMQLPLGPGDTTPPG